MAPFVAQYLYVIYGLILTVVGLCIFIDANRSDRSPRRDAVEYLASVSIALAGYVILWVCSGRQTVFSTPPGGIPGGLVVYVTAIAALSWLVTGCAVIKRLVSGSGD